jgi:hypothetical protein
MKNIYMRAEFSVIALMIAAVGHATDHPKTYPSYTSQSALDGEGGCTYSFKKGKATEYGFGCDGGATPVSIDVHCTNDKDLKVSGGGVPKDSGAGRYFARFTVKNKSSSNDHDVVFEKIDCASSSTTGTSIKFNYDNCKT